MKRKQLVKKTQTHQCLICENTGHNYVLLQQFHSSAALLDKKTTFSLHRAENRFKPPRSTLKFQGRH